MIAPGNHEDYEFAARSTTLKGEAFGGNLNLLQQNKQRWIRDKASPLGEKLSAIGSSEPMAD